MAETYLDAGAIDMIEKLRGRPIGPAMAAHLLSLFGKEGEAARIAAAQDAAWAACPNSDGERCYDDSCGYCAPYRDGPLLDEVLADIQAFERGVLTLDEKGVPLAVDTEDLLF